jgi:hypothetical protein
LVTLIGATQRNARAYLTLGAAVPADLPARIDAGTVEQLDERRYRVSAPGREWILDARCAFVHHDVSGAVRAALPPRRVPLVKRLFWRLLLAFAASRAGRWWSTR